jgi:thioester reductase-like protein
MIKGCVQLGRAPDLRTRVEMVPVDYVARAIVLLSRVEGGAPGRTFHLTNPGAPDLRKLVGWMRHQGYALEVIPFEDWKQQLAAAPDFASNALYPFWPLLSQLRAEESIVPVGDCRSTLQALARTPLRCPAADDALFRTYFDFYIRSGFMQAPEQTAADGRLRLAEEETG